MDRTITYLVEQSLRGHHHLFEPGIVRFALQHAGPAGAGGASAQLDPETAREVVRLLDAIEADGEVVRQHDRIAGAPLPVQEVLVRVYFDVLYRYMEWKRPVLH